MRKALLFTVFAILALSCGKEEMNIQPVQEEDIPKLEINFTVTDASSPDTRAVKSAWARKDKIYVLFDKEINFGPDNPPQYLVLAYDKSGDITGNADSWFAETWSPGLERKIAHRSSGTLCAIYVPNDKVEGTISIEQSSSTQYNVFSKDRAGKTFYSYALVDQNRSYTVKDGVLTASLTLKAAAGDKWMQHCIKKDRSGASFTNADSHRYTLKHQTLSSTGGDYRFTQAVYPYEYNSDGFRFDASSTVMSAYFYAGLCFAGYNTQVLTAKTRHIFTLVDNKGTTATSDDITYVYTWPESGYGQLTSSAIVLPDLNVKNTAGAYKWVQQ